MRNQRGFTLIELMTVIAIIGVVVGLALNVDARGYSKSPQAAADQIVSTLSLARTRAETTRRIHRVQVQPTQVSIWQATTTGLTTPTNWQLVSTTKLPAGVSVWNASSGAVITTGASPTQDGSLAYPIDFRPDGQATAATLYLTNQTESLKYRVLVYHVAGGFYARESW